jgi:hypothetical protein
MLTDKVIAPLVDGSKAEVSFNFDQKLIEMTTFDEKTSRGTGQGGRA